MYTLRDTTVHLCIRLLKLVVGFNQLLWWLIHVVKKFCVWANLSFCFQLRQLLRPYGVRRCTCKLRVVGYSWTGGLRSTPASLLSTDGRLSHLLLRRLTLLIRQRLVKVGPGNQASLRGHASSLNRWVGRANLYRFPLLFGAKTFLCFSVNIEIAYTVKPWAKDHLPTTTTILWSHFHFL